MKPLLALSSSVNLNLPNSPPAYSRMPPDGHEFPQNYLEVDPNVDLYELHSPASIKSPLYPDAYCTRKTTPPPAPYTDAPHEAKLPDVGRKYADATHPVKPYPFQHDSSSKRHSQSWRNDERSECSVKDKIAMFSSAISKATPAFSRGGVRSRRDVVDHRGPSKAFSKSSFAVNAIGGGGASCPKTNEPPSYCLRDSVDSTNCCPSVHINRTQSSIDLTLFSSSCLSAYPSRSPDTSLSPMSSPSYTIGSSSTLPRKHKSHVMNGGGGNVASDSGARDKKHAALGRTTSFSAPTSAPLHSRSQSLVDVLHTPTVARTGDEHRKDSLTTLIEQRRRTMSKLRGLVIPERSVDEVARLKPIVDLPEIKCKEVMLNNGSATSLLCRDSGAPPKTTKTEVTTSYVDCSWRTVLNAVDIPKYSPAFKRKTLTVYGVFSSASSLSSSLNSSREELRDAVRKSPPAKPPRACNTQLAYGPAAYKSIFGGGGVGQQPQQPPPSAESRNGHDSQITTTTTTTNNNNSNNNDYRISRNEVSKLQEDSDNDSAVSSSRSSLCQEYSPPSSPSPNGAEYDSSANDRVSNGSPSQSSSRTLRRTLSSETNVSLMSAASTLTSGSQASCSSNGDAYKEPGKRVLKAESVEAINRKNVLSSARYSCGQDFKVGSPLIKDVYEGLARFGDGFGDAACDEEREWFEYEKYDKDASLGSMKIAYLEIQDGDESDYSVKGSSSADTDEALDKSLDSTDSICGNYKSDFAMEKRAKDADATSEVAFAMERAEMTNGVEGVRKGKSDDDDDDDVDSHVSSGFSDEPKKSVGDIKKTFEKCERVVADKQVTQLQNHLRMSSTDSTTSEESFPVVVGHILNTNLLKEQQFGSITSLASSTSLISQQELQQLIDDANQTLEETAGGGEHDLMVIILHRDTVTSSIGITLAGGADYEAKEITVHKVLVGSPADKDGRIQKGDRILSINGRNMKGVTHREALSILKAPRPEVVLVVSRWKTDGLGRNTTMVEDPLVATFKNNLRPPRIPEVTQDCDTENVTSSTTNNISDKTTKGPITTITLVKEGGGLGFSLEGGKDSPLGDLPLTIKKIFTGGCAAKSGLLTAGDELISLNGVDVSAMSRTEAWSMMKRLSDGQIVLNIRRSLK